MKEKTWARRLEPDLYVWASSQINLPDHCFLRCQIIPEQPLFNSGNWCHHNNPRSSFQIISHYNYVDIKTTDPPSDHFFLRCLITVVNGHQNNHCYNDNWCHHKFLPANSFWSDERQHASWWDFLERNFTEILSWKRFLQRNFKKILDKDKLSCWSGNKQDFMFSRSTHLYYTYRVFFFTGTPLKS